MKLILVEQKKSLASTRYLTKDFNGPLVARKMGQPQKALSTSSFSVDKTSGTMADEEIPEAQDICAKPFLKWVGGKRSILPKLLERTPKKYNVYKEPFLGGGALFFATQPSRAYLSDINFLLILTYQAVQEDLDRLILNLKYHARLHNKDYYLRARKRLPRENDKLKIAALFIYLNKTCYNGLYRVNKNGEFNVPIGDYIDPSLFNEEILRKDSEILRNVTLKQHEFSQTAIEKDDFFYLDPPYHKTYDGYNGNGFGDDDHKELCEFCKKIDKSGAMFMLSNSDTKLIRSIYSGFSIEEVQSLRSISCQGNQRGKENEIIIRNY
jgi:DNA adenine methylase